LARGLIGSKQGAKCAIITHAQYVAFFYNFCLTIRLLMFEVCNRN